MSKDQRIMKYVPKRLKEAVKDAYRDDDGYWVIFKDSWEYDGVHGLHEETISMLRSYFRYVEHVSE